MRILQHWQFPSQAEKSLAEMCDLALAHGQDTIMMKALDGTMWMQIVDRNPDALGSYDDVQRSADYCHSRNLQFGVWFNPLLQNMTTQAIMAAECIKRCDLAGFDTEPYAGFLGPYPPLGVCAAYMDTIVGEVGKDKPLIWQPDPRHQHLIEIRQDEWGPRMTHYAPQVYVQDFYLAPSQLLMRALLDDANAVASQYGLIACPTLPGNASTDLIPDFLGTFQGYVVWRVGSTPISMLDFLGGIQLTTTPPTDPPAPDPNAEREKLVVFLADIADRVVVDRLQTELNRAGMPRRSVLHAVINETIAERTQALGPRLAPPRSASAVQEGVILEPQGDILEGANPHVEGSNPH
jgi:hypothetical protein